MPVPALTDGVLPEGAHDCTLAEVEAAFGRFQATDRRLRLMDALGQYLPALWRTGLPVAVYLDGSFVTAKPDPDDIDILIALPADWDPFPELKPFQYNLLFNTGMRRLKYPFDVYAFPDGSDRFQRMLTFFGEVNPEKHAGLTMRTRKGLLRVSP